jgi:Flp pilus assembly protein TadD
MNVLRLLAVVAAGIAAYAGVGAVPFVFGDDAGIVRNLGLRQLWPAPLRAARPVLELTFAADYRLFGLEVAGWHAVNVALHVLCALLLLDVARRTLLLAGAPAKRAFRVAWWAALLFVVHPLATGAVTYVSGRSEVLLGVLYLATLDLFLLGEMHPAARGLFWTGSVLTAALGMATGPAMVTAPLAVVWLARSVCPWPVPLRIWFANDPEPTLPPEPPARWPVFTGLLLTWVVLAYLVATRDFRAGGLDLDVGVAPYLRAQLGVAWHYVRLLVWPVGLSVDYDWPVPGSWLDPGVLRAGAAWLVVAVVLVWLFRRRVQPAAFWLGLAILLPLPTTSVVPLLDVASEPRMYLTIGAVAVLAALAVDAVTRRASRVGTTLVLLVVLALGVVTQRRNEVWADPVRLWTDALARAPAKARVFRNLLRAYEQRGDEAGMVRVATSEVGALESLRVRRPHDPELLTALGNAYSRVGRASEALVVLSEAARLAPEDPVARASYGALLLQLGRPMQAIAQLEMAEALTEGQRGWSAAEVRLSVRTNLGWAYASVNRTADAVRVLRQAAAGDDVSALNNLGSILARAGRWDDARDVLERAHRFEPSDPHVQSNLGWVYANSGRLAEATALLEAAIRGEPSDAAAHGNLGWVRLQANDPAGAVPALTMALTLQPENGWAAHMLGIAQARLGDWDAAVRSLERAVQLLPDPQLARLNLERARAHAPLLLPDASG